MIITIDGVSASGKSTLAKLLAQNLNFFYLNSGFLYRTYAYLLTKKLVPLNQLEIIDLDRVKELIDIQDLNYIYEHNNLPHIFYKSEDITDKLKTKDMDLAAAKVGVNVDIRNMIKEWQYRIVANYPSIVTDGRDMGTNIFPNADYKFFLTASLQERAKRWKNNQASKGHDYSIEEATKVINDRDTSDINRIFAKAIPGVDCTTIDNTNLTTEETLKFISKLITGV